MQYDETKKIYRTSINITSQTEQYSLGLKYNSNDYALSLRLLPTSSDINLAVNFLVPEYCRDGYVEEAERTAQINNIPEALSRFLLASYLLDIQDENSKCRYNQPKRLQKARVDREIQLATFYGSPFIVTDESRARWASVLGSDLANHYAAQALGNEATTLKAAISATVKNARSQEDLKAASSLNDLLRTNISGSSEVGDIYKRYGVTEKLVTQNEASIQSKTLSLPMVGF